jgi:hypothetical protein
MPLGRTTHIAPRSIRTCYEFPSNLIRSSYPRSFNPSRLFHYFIVTLCLALILLILLVVIVVPVVLTFPKTRRTRTDLPTVEIFRQDNGTKWHIEYVGNIKFTGPMGEEGLGGDKCRSSLLAGRHIWNCGDMMCGSVLTTCGFDMGPAFYGTRHVSVIDAAAYSTISDYEFATPWSDDPKPVSPQTAYGMDTSNIVSINKTTGIAYVWEITRGDPNGSHVDQGAGVVAVTIGPTKPIGKRVGPLLTGPESVQLGLMSIIQADGYIYNYNQQGPFGNILVGRVEAGEAAFDAQQYEYLVFPSDSTTAPKWIPGIPAAQDAASYGMRTSESTGRFTCSQYGSVTWSKYFSKYMLMCNLYLNFTFFYLAENPWGPWTGGFQLLSDSGWLGYGVDAHPQWSARGKENELYFSQGPNGPLNMFKLTFYY